MDHLLHDDLATRALLSRLRGRGTMRSMVEGAATRADAPTSTSPILNTTLKLSLTNFRIVINCAGCLRLIRPES